MPTDVRISARQRRRLAIRAPGATLTTNPELSADCAALRPVARHLALAGGWHHPPQLRRGCAPVTPERIDPHACVVAGPAGYHHDHPRILEEHGYEVVGCELLESRRAHHICNVVAKLRG